MAIIGRILKSLTPDFESILDIAEPGEITPEGLIFTGKSPHTGKPMLALPHDLDYQMTWAEALIAPQSLSKQFNIQNRNLRLPSLQELAVIVSSKHKIANFDLSGHFATGWYWTASEFNRWEAYAVRFNDSYKGPSDKRAVSSVRLICD